MLYLIEQLELSIALSLLKLVLLKALFLVLHFSYYTSMTFLMLYVILLSILILLSTLSVIKHLICGTNQRWPLILVYKTMQTRVGSGLLISMLEKRNFDLTGLKTLVLLRKKWIGLLLKKNHILRCWDFLSLLNWIGALILSLFLKFLSIKLEP